MTIAQGESKQKEAEGLKDAAQNNASQISSTSEKDELGDKSLDDVSGGNFRPFSTYGKGG